MSKMPKRDPVTFGDALAGAMIFVAGYVAFLFAFAPDAAEAHANLAPARAALIHASFLDEFSVASVLAGMMAFAAGWFSFDPIRQAVARLAEWMRPDGARSIETDPIPDVLDKTNDLIALFERVLGRPLKTSELDQIIEARDIKSYLEELGLAAIVEEEIERIKAGQRLIEGMSRSGAR